MKLLYLGLYLCSIVAGATNCQQLSNENQERLLSYVRKIYRMPQPAVVWIEKVATQPSCFYTIHLGLDNGKMQAALLLYLSPNQQLVMRDLTNLAQPADDNLKQIAERRKRNEKIENPVLGSRNAPTIIEIFSDFQCPYCRGAAAIVKETALKNNEQVQVIFRHLPLPSHSWAALAAQISACVYDSKPEAFWPLHDALFLEQQQIRESNARTIILEQATRFSNLSANEITACLESGKGRQLVHRDLMVATEERILTTPSIFVNGWPLRGAISTESLEEAILRAKETRPLRSSSTN